MRKFSSYAMITVKGIGMGAADVIPGVSGGKKGKADPGI